MKGAGHLARGGGAASRSQAVPPGSSGGLTISCEHGIREDQLGVYRSSSGES